MRRGLRLRDCQGACLRRRKQANRIRHKYNFPALERVAFVTEPAEGVAFMEDLASGVVSEESFRNWLEQRSTVIK